MIGGTARPLLFDGETASQKVFGCPFTESFGKECNVMYIWADGQTALGAFAGLIR